MRDITDAFRTAVTAGTVYPIILFEADFDEGTERAWHGAGTLSYGGNNYLGLGKLLKFDLPEETTEIEARGAAFELGGVDEEDISVALAEDYQGRPIRILFGLFNVAGEVISDIIRLFSGRMDVMAINDDPAAPTITLSAENDLIKLNRAKERRYTHEDQQIDYPGDKFFEFVTSMQDKQIIWG